MFYLYKETYIYLYIIAREICALSGNIAKHHRLVMAEFIEILGLWVSKYVVDGPLDLFRHRWSNWQVSTLWVISVLVGGVRNGDRSAVRSGVLILTLGDDHGFSLGSDRLWRALLGSRDSVLGLIGIVVGSFGRDVLRLPQNSHRLLLMLSHNDGH